MCICVCWCGDGGVYMDCEESWRTKSMGNKDEDVNILMPQNHCRVHYYFRMYI